MLANMQKYVFISRNSHCKLADGWAYFAIDGKAVWAISLCGNDEYRPFCCFFTIVYCILDCKLVFDRFCLIYGIAENPRLGGQSVILGPAVEGLITCFHIST